MQLKHGTAQQMISREEWLFLNALNITVFFV